MRFERQQAFERRVGAVAFVAFQVMLFLTRDLAGLLVHDSAGDLHRRDLAFEKSFGLRAGGALLAGERVFVLSFTADLVSLGDDFVAFAPHHINSGVLFLNPWIGF